MKIQLELFKFNASTLTIKQIAANVLPHSIRLDNEENHRGETARVRRCRRRCYEVALNSINTTNSDLLSARVRLKLHHVRTVLPSSPESVALLKFVPSPSCSSENELTTLIDRFLDTSPATQQMTTMMTASTVTVTKNNSNNNDCSRRFRESVTLIPKCLELLAYLGSAKNSTAAATASHLSSTSINQDTTIRGNHHASGGGNSGGGLAARNNLMIRVFECLVRVIEKTSTSCPHFDFYLLQAPLKQVNKQSFICKILI